MVAFAYDAEIDGIYYNLDKKNNTAQVTRNMEYSGEVNIPSTITYEEKTYVVTSIAELAFYYCYDLNSITIPSTITEIGCDAFQWCLSLKSITIPDGVSRIEDRVFFGCQSLTSIVIPEGVIYIGDNAFGECSNLFSISISNRVAHIGNSAFGGTAWFNNQQDGCIYINNSFYAYKGEMPSNTHIDVKEGTEQICGYAFKNYVQLNSITLPNSVRHIGIEAFSGCTSLTSIAFPDSINFIGDYAFSDCSSLSSIVIGNSVTSIGSLVFTGCSSLTSIDVDENNPNYASIDGVLYDKNITTLMCCPQGKTLVTIPNSVTSIGDYAFSYCSSLTSVTIGNSVTSIGSFSFYGCQSLTSIIIQAENPPTIFEYTFENVSRSISIKVPCGSKVKYQTAQYWKEFVNYEEVPAGTLTVDVNDKTMGFATVTKPNSCTDDVAQVQAQALAGYEFVRWSDGATENPHILLVTEDMTITAEFRKIGEEPEDKPGEEEKHNNFIVESADKTQGAVEITITAKAIEGFEFDHWSDGSTENPRIVTLDEDVELYAYFRIAGTANVETSVISSASVYGSSGVLYVKGVETDYHVLDAAGRLIYTGREAQLQLPRGVYMVAVGGEVQKVVI